MAVLGLALNIPVAVATRLVTVAFAVATHLVAASTGDLVLAVARVLEHTTKVGFNAEFVGEFRLLSELGGMLAVPLLMLTAIQAVVRQDLGLLLRMAFVRLPLVLIGSGIVVALVKLALGATDELSDGLLSIAGPPAQSYLHRLSVGFLVLNTPGQLSVLFVALIGAGVSLLLWLELALRSAAVAVATLFTPIALCGLVWPATAHWARRLGETLTALIFAKPVIAAVLSLSVGSVLGGGLNGLVEGVALLLLAAFAPLTLLKLVPFIDQSVAGHLEGLTHRAAGAAAGQVGGTVDSIAGLTEDFNEGARPVGLHPGTPMDPGVDYGELYAQTAAEMAAVAEARATGTEVLPLELRGDESGSDGSGSDDDE